MTLIINYAVSFGKQERLVFVKILIKVNNNWMAKCTFVTVFLPLSFTVLRLVTK